MTQWPIPELLSKTPWGANIVLVSIFMLTKKAGSRKYRLHIVLYINMFT